MSIKNKVSGIGLRANYENHDKNEEEEPSVHCTNVTLFPERKNYAGTSPYWHDFPLNKIPLGETLSWMCLLVSKNSLRESMIQRCEKDNF